MHHCKGKFLNTADGVTHYILQHPGAKSLSQAIGGRIRSTVALNGFLRQEEPLLVVLLHGLQGSSTREAGLARQLLRMGHSVLRFDFYDRGFSRLGAGRFAPAAAASPAAAAGEGEGADDEAQAGPHSNRGVRRREKSHFALPGRNFMPLF